MFKAPLSFYGRIRRTEFALTQILYMITYFFVLVFENNKAVGSWIVIILLLPIYLLISQGAKRCHDLGRSGWWQLVPFYGLMMFFAAGDFGPNQYGDNPKGEGNADYDEFGYDFKTGKMMGAEGSEPSQALREIKPD
ncbi:DUF805 domain-containing protein [Pedobacter sp. KBS0701]|uniref:DUF805 domain-containing protein n=1 Tax=Pedobacter sp. KBS0701 TaxID=2578106 RepID=UPI00110DE2F6|nr:DUF805 domain-containing protein [Pedobacter sp. KBS0701]QDW24324.1 DUF805 domain-containing protein [Pedobacter sp. KBS0701]QDW25247.1 DUF805 domain-containing protein [Pedobacter sp. KBS0701]